MQVVRDTECTPYNNVLVSLIIGQFQQFTIHSYILNVTLSNDCDYLHDNEKHMMFLLVLNHYIIY